MHVHANKRKGKKQTMLKVSLRNKEADVNLAYHQKTGKEIHACSREKEGMPGEKDNHYLPIGL